MEQDVKLGADGSLDLSLSSGKATLSLAYAPLGASVSVSLDSAALLDLLFKAIESKSPAGAVAIEESVKSVLKEAVAKL